MTTLAELYRAGLSSDQKDAWRRASIEGASDSDIMNWFDVQKKDPKAIEAGRAALEANPDRYGKADSLIHYLDPNFKGYGYNESETDGRAQWDQSNQNILRQAKAFDPNAALDASGQLQMDRSKLPAFAGGNANAKYVGNGLSDLRTNDGTGRVQDPSKVIHDANYGNFTVANNLSTAPGDSDSGFMGQLGKYAPAVISTIMSAGMGAAAGPLLGSLLSAGIGPGGIGNKLAMGEPIDWGKTALNAGIGAAGGILGGAGGIVPPEVSSVFKQISPYINLGNGIYGARKGNVGSGIVAGLTLGQLLQNGMGGG